MHLCLTFFIFQFKPCFLWKIYNWSNVTKASQTVPKYLESSKCNKIKMLRDLTQSLTRALQKVHGNWDEQVSLFWCRNSLKQIAFSKTHFLWTFWRPFIFWKVQIFTHDAITKTCSSVFWNRLALLQPAHGEQLD